MDADILQAIEEDIGLSIELVIQKWTSRDEARRIKRNTVIFIGECVGRYVYGCDPETADANRLQDNCRG